jgi:flagellin-like hook-associated protein FlgL
MTMKYLNGINSTLTNLVDANEKVQKGRNLLNPETDPVNYLTAFNLQRYVDDANQYLRNGNNAETWLKNEDTELQTASSLISKALNDLAITGRNDSQNAESRKALAGEVSSILQSMVDIGNAEYLDRFIFGGYETERKPFTSGEREVTSVVSNLNGGQAFGSKLYSDMPDLEEGAYTLNATVVNGVVNISMIDSRNKNVILDSNGSDDSTDNGNLTSATLTTEYQEGMVISTGRGVAVKLPDEDMNGKTLKLQFYYKPGDDVRYIGDDGKISTKIGANQDVTLNVTGEEVFMETNRAIQGTIRNTVNGVAISETTYFSEFDGSNISISDSISFSGTDHNGYIVGNARISGPGNANLDMTHATEAQRTVSITYAGKTKNITLDQKGYEDMDELIFNLNRHLDNANLGGEITAVNDGDKIMFMTRRTGNNVQLSVTGSDHNALGFKNTTLSATGKDTTFDLSYDSYFGPVETVHDDLPIGVGNHTYYINDTAIDFTVGAGDTASDIQDKINNAISAKGIGFQNYAKVEAGTNSDYKVTFVTENQNLTKDTYLSTRVDSGAADEYQFATPRSSNYPIADEKRVSDMLTFIEGLYDNAVDAEIIDGKLKISDLRSGTSRMTFNITEENTGIGYAMLDKNIVYSGRYSGSADDQWSTDVNVAGGNITIRVSDQKGNVLFDNSANPIVQANYNGEPIYLAQGVSISLGEITASSSFVTDMTAYSNMSFGDLNVVEEGENVDVFRTLGNLQDALFYNIPDSGIGAPSAWRDESLNSTAKPYFDGEFRGNYNDQLNFEVQYFDNKNEFYIQKEQKWQSQDVQFFQDADINFDLILKSDQTTPALTSKNYSFPAGSYTSDEDLIDSIVETINGDLALQEIGVVAYNEGGKLKIDSGSGNTEITTHYNNIDTAITFGLAQDAKVGSQQPKPDLIEPSTVQINYLDGGNWASADIVIPAGNYGDTAGLIAEVNNQITLSGAPLAGNVTAAVDSNGKILFNNSAPIDDIVVSGDENGNLGFYRAMQPNTIRAAERPTLDVSEKDIESRTLTFNYNDGSDKTASIVVDAENFATIDDLVENMNAKLADQGLNDMSVVKVGENNIGFSFGGAVNSMHVSGDYEGTFGIEKGGDIAKMKITSASGELVNSYTLDTANQRQFVADGVYHHYDTGYVYATDSYDVAIGSGIEHEMPVLERAETQIHGALTTVGNRANRVESAYSFNSSLITMNEGIKAEYTGSTTIDQSKAMTDFTVAQNVYQAALQSTAKILQISLLNYL